MNSRTVDNRNNEFIKNLFLIVSFIVFLLSFCTADLFHFLKEYASIYLLFLYSLIFVLSNRSKDKKRYFIIFALIFFLSLNSFFGDYTLGSSASVINAFLFLLIIDKINFGKFELSILKIICACLYILFIFSNHDFLNTNYVGYIYLLFYLLFNNLFDFSNGHFLKKAVNVLLLIVTLYVGNKYECRTAQLVTIMVFIIQIIPSGFLKLKSIKKTLPYLLTVGSLVVAYIYVSMWKNNIMIDLSDFASKSLYSGRNRIWDECFSLIASNPITGIGANYILKSHFVYALHNSMMMIVTTFGIPIFVLFVYSFRNFIHKVYELCVASRRFPLVIITIIGIFLVDFFESYFYWSLFNLIIFITVTIAINQSKGERIINEEKI